MFRTLVLDIPIHKTTKILDQLYNSGFLPVCLYDKDIQMNKIYITMKIPDDIVDQTSWMLEKINV